MDEPDSTIQVSIRADAVEGWRAWRLIPRGDGSLGLGSLFSPDERWRPRSAARAVCAVEGSYHPAPAVDCRCGYYAYADRARLAGASRRSGVIGAVSMWGSVVGHDFGFRAEYAYPQRLRLVCGPCLRIGRDRTPRWVVTRHGELTAVCEWHTPRPRARGSRMRADAVEAGLLAAYAVEVLPPTGLSAPPLRHRVVRAVRSLLGTKTSIGWLLLAVLVASVAFNAASRSDEGTPKPLVVSSNGAESPVIGTDIGAKPDIGAGLHHPSAGVVVRTACGVGRASRIEVVPCSRPHEWMSTAIFHAGVLPKCFGAVVETRPNGRSVCWVPIGASESTP